MSLSSLLGIARSALLTHQKAVDVTAHNIANATTEGYTRQRLRLEAAEPLRTPYGTIGRGVTGETVERVRSQFLDRSVREESGRLGRFDTMRDLLGRVQEVIGEPGDDGLATALDALFDAFADLANDPSGDTPRLLVRQQAGTFVTRVRATDDRLAALGNEAMEQLRDTVGQVNRIAAEIADLNRQIQVAAKQGAAPDLEDRRDLLIDQLAEIMDVQVVRHENGTVGVVGGGALLVDRVHSQTLTVRTDGDRVGVGVDGTAGTIDPGSGRMKGLVEFAGSTLPELRGRLDGFVRAVVTEINAIHRTGMTATMATGRDFFDPTGLTASTIALATEVAASADEIAAGTTGMPGDGSVALRIAALRTNGAAAAGGQTLGELYTGVVATLAVLTRGAEQAATAQEALVSSVRAQRSSVADVSTDEEMVALIRHQQAYAAASKIVTVADEMIRSVLDMV